MRIRILMMALALAIAGTMAVNAFNEAQIDTDASAAVVRTEDALLALSCNSEHDEFGICDDTGGTLLLDFGNWEQPGTSEEYDLNALAFGAFYGSKQDDPKYQNQWYIYVEWQVDEGRTERREYPIPPNEHSNAENHPVSVVGPIERQGPNCFLVPWEQDKPGNDFAGQLEICLPPLGSDPVEGLLRGDVTEIVNVIKVTNNTNETVDIGVRLTGELADSEINVSVSADPGGTLYPGNATASLAPGKYAWLSFRFDVPQDVDVESDLSGTFTITGEAVPGD